MYELFDHTADLGLRVVAADLDTLFREAAEGLFSVIAESGSPDAEGESLELRVEGDRPDYLLIDWLSELLYVFETRKLLLDRFDVTTDDRGLTAKARARPLDLQRDRLLHEVKAVTYHRLRLERSPEGFVAEVILDI